MSHDPLTTLCHDLAARAKAAAGVLATASTDRKNAWLLAAAARLESESTAVLAANAKDVAAAPGFGLTPAAVDRLTLTPARLRAAADGLRQVAALPDPVGTILDGSTRPNGFKC
jgi:glutamate-5-semialdehyde dehydrogenase